MPGRSNSNNRCRRCRMYRPLCLCAEIPIIHLRTKIVIVMHCREQKLTTNTATLATLALPNSEIHLRGERGNSLQAEILLTSGEKAGILFPTDDAVELTQE